MAPRRALLLLAASLLVIGMLAGLARVGAIRWGGAPVAEHGPLLVIGVFGTVIAIERAVALGKYWAQAAAACAALVGVGAVAHAPSFARVLAPIAALGLAAINLALWRRERGLAGALTLLASVLNLIGATGWASGHAVSESVPQWLAFFVLTIAAERLELSRLSPSPKEVRTILLGLSALLALASLPSRVHAELQARTFGVLIAAVGVWLLYYDVARRTVRIRGLPRFSAVAALLAAAWLVIAGGIAACKGLPTVGPDYDAVLHGVFVGFVLSMVFAHAFVIVPAVARFPVPYVSAAYLPLGFLHLTLSARIVGDLAGSPELRRAGALGNAITFVLLVAVILGSKLSTSELIRATFARVLPRRSSPAQKRVK